MKFFFNDQGFSTAGVAVALLLVFSLVFASVHSYELLNASAEVQYVADAAALAAENEIASFVTAVRICDSILLSMSLVGVALIGVGLVCCCVPQSAATGSRLVDGGVKVLNQQKKVAKNMIQVLNTMQSGLGLAAITQASMVVAQNSNTRVSYFGVAEVAPMVSDPIENPLDSVSTEVVDDIPQQSDDIAQKSQEAEQASARAGEALHEAYMHDCGFAPGYCLYERANTLSSIAPSDNPYVLSEDAWSFEMPLKRAQAYYKSRASIEVPYGETFEEQINSILRARFYDYAVKALAEGYVTRSGDVIVDMYFPQLPSNVDELKQTTLYTDVVYPYSEHEGERVLHAWSGCPLCGEPSGKGSLAQMDAGSFKECPVCHFDTVELARVAAASTSIDNGFEYHYRKIAEASVRYTEALSIANPLIKEVKEDIDGIFEELKDLLQSLVGVRIKAFPPGRYGALAAVQANWGSSQSDLPFVSSQDVEGGAAISAAVLVDDSQMSVLETSADAVQDASMNLGIPFDLSFASTLWDAALRAYSEGSEGFISAVEDVLNTLPLVSHSGLGDWAAKELKKFLDDIGLAPGCLAVPKAVLVNTGYILTYADGVISRSIRGFKNAFVESSL